MYKRLFASLFALILSAPLALIAGEKEDVSAIKTALAKIMPDSTPDSISPAALTGLYQVVFGAQVLYLSPDGRYVIQGDLIDLDKQENITESARSIQRAKLVKNIDDSTAIIFKPADVKYSITVFTDIDCGYCRKLHQEIEQYLAEGIQIRYLAFPRSGVNTKSYFKAVNVWCAKDQHKAMTDAKAGIPQEKQECDNPVESHLKLGEQFGVTGTPTLVLDSGDVVPGYVPAPRLKQMLQKMKSAAL